MYFDINLYFDIFTPFFILIDFQVCQLIDYCLCRYEPISQEDLFDKYKGVAFTPTASQKSP